MDKLKMAHDWYMKHADGRCRNLDAEVEQAWHYADAMQAEADGRVNKERSHALEDAWMKEVEKDARFYGVGFVRFLNKDGFLSAERLDPKLVILSRTEQEEWQPDWSQAPDDCMKWWCMDEDGCANWFNGEPTLGTGEWDLTMNQDNFMKAPSFGYIGKWQDSLRKRS